ncbi:MAG: hypothetical protein LAN63_04290 [Acidobacteriia bacterium]|nr:hypothetical protein [Terriglobia bacterium]
MRRTRAFSRRLCEGIGAEKKILYHLLHHYHHLVYNKVMKRATMTLPDDLARAVENYQRAQEAPPALTAVVQAALRQYLGERGFLRVRRTLDISPASSGSGRHDVSQEHDRYLAGTRTPSQK